MARPNITLVDHAGVKSLSEARRLVRFWSDGANFVGRGAYLIRLPRRMGYEEVAEFLRDFYHIPLGVGAGAGLISASFWGQFVRKKDHQILILTADSATAGHAVVEAGTLKRVPGILVRATHVVAWDPA